MSMKYNIIYIDILLIISTGTPVSSTNKTDRHDIAEILLKVTLSTITQTPYYNTSLLRGQYT